MTRPHLLRLTAGLLFVSAAPALAQDLDFQLNAALSSADVSADTSTALASTVIGDYDATDNPGGTRTVPGFFGGGGNNPIPMDLTLGTSTGFLGAPSGGFGLDIDAPGLAAVVHDLDVDLLGGGTADSTLSLGFLYDTFRTFAPDSLYIGGIPFDLPIAGQTISEFLLVQTDDAPAVLIPGPNAGEFRIVAAVPAELSFNVDFQGQVTPVGPVPMVLPLTGTLIVTGATATVQFDFAQSFQQQILDPLPGFVITDVPLPLPTILPPGGTANLLLDATIASLDVDFSATVLLVADGAPSCGFDSYCPANANSTGFGAELVASGSADVADANLTLTATQLPSNVNGLFFMSQTRAQVPIFQSEGLLCLGAPQIRFSGLVMNSGAGGTMVFSPDFGGLPQGVMFQPGSTWNFQLWFRDANPLNTSNTTNGAEVRFCP